MSQFLDGNVIVGEIVSGGNAIPGTQVTHRVLPIRKLAPTLKGYPRRWARIQKQPL